MRLKGEEGWRDRDEEKKRLRAGDTVPHKKEGQKDSRGKERRSG